MKKREKTNYPVRQLGNTTMASTVELAFKLPSVRRLFMGSRVWLIMVGGFIVWSICVPSIPLVVADNKILDDILSHFLLCRIAGDIICFVEAAEKDVEWLLVGGMSLLH
jgi:hypothetical protein